MKIEVQLLSKKGKLPTKNFITDAGLDIYSSEDFSVGVDERKLIHTDIAMGIPINHVGIIKSRSGLSNKHGINILGGVIDYGYTGEVGVIIHNTGFEVFNGSKHDKIAQMVILPIPEVEIKKVKTLSKSERGTNGFGSSGK
jgi:dUTP pyrophosphatase